MNASLAVTQSGSNWSSNVAQYGGASVVTGVGNSGSGIPRFTVAQDSNLQVVGEVASGAADSGNPQKIGGLAKTTNPTAVTDGQRVSALFDKQGKMVAVGALRQLKGVAKQSIVNTTETTIVAAAASTFNDVYAIVCTNKSAVNLFVDFKDSLAGTTRMTLAVPASDTRGFTVAVDSAMVQAAVNTAWTATLSTTPTSASVEITMLYVSNL
jgi:hypothetical protein